MPGDHLWCREMGDPHGVDVSLSLSDPWHNPKSATFGTIFLSSVKIGNRTHNIHRQPPAFAFSHAFVLDQVIEQLTSTAIFRQNKDKSVLETYSPIQTIFG
jgi:hypothetical protein